jgi:hypothetical protein
MHFLSNSDEEEEHADYLHFDAGILVGSGGQKEKPQKFKPHRSKNAVHHHHGSFVRRNDHHGWTQSPRSTHGFSSPDIPPSPNTKSAPITTPRIVPRSRRTLSGHRHSWREPSPNIFTLDEELPQIIVSDYDAASDSQDLSSSEISVLNISSIDKDSNPLSDPNDATQSTRLEASLPVDDPDTKLNQMWFAERARL